MALLLRTLLLLALAIGGSAALAGQACLVMSDEASAFGEAAEALGNELRSAGHRLLSFPPPLRAEDSAALNNCALIVTLGARAAQGIAALAPRSLILHTLLPRSAYERLPLRAEDARRVSAIFIDQPASRQIELLRVALPDWQRVALLVGHESLEMGQRLYAAARDRRLRPTLAQLNEESELYPTLQRTLAEPSILLAVPDATVYNNRTISNILLTAYHQRSPVVGFSPAYVKAGALLALYSTPAQVGQQAGEAARLGLATGSLPPPAAPRHFRISTNPYVARSLGIQLEDPAFLHERLERSEGSQ
ncbi:ABC transporter substrate-binding protein [Zoogloea sp.]|uniref:ABC transporter substrate-binding protein n=1 Tax=Zoogloea sp. TaxID=49181 RepID=UPI0035B0BA90